MLGSDISGIVIERELDPVAGMSSWEGLAGESCDENSGQEAGMGGCETGEEGRGASDVVGGSLSCTSGEWPGTDTMPCGSVIMGGNAMRGGEMPGITSEGVMGSVSGTGSLENLFDGELDSRQEGGVGGSDSDGKGSGVSGAVGGSMPWISDEGPSAVTMP